LTTNKFKYPRNTANIQKSNTKIDVFQSGQYISPLAIVRELKISAIKDLD